MSRYKVTLRPLKNGNPFEPVHIDLNPMPVEMRVFEMDVPSKKAVRDFFDAAVKENHPHIRGHAIHSIVELPPTVKQEAT